MPELRVGGRGKLFGAVPLLALLNLGKWAKGAGSMVLQLTFSLHYHAVMLFVLAVATGIGIALERAALGDLMMLLMLAFLVLSIRGAFGTSWARALLRGVVVFLVYVAVALSTAVLYGLMALGAGS
jgi:hypothetical protein